MSEAVVDRLAEAFRCNLVTRKEYDALFLSITRLTDRIEALESMVGSYDLDRTEFPADTPRAIIHAALVHQGRRK